MITDTTISPVVLGHLSQARCKDNHCILLPMSREDQAETVAVLRLLGATWSSTAHAYVFPIEVRASAVIVSTYQTRTIPRAVAEPYRETPSWLADVMARVALCDDLKGWLSRIPKPYVRGGVVVDFEGGDLELPDRVVGKWPTTLEPSAGDGALLWAMHRALGDLKRPRAVRAVERDTRRADALKGIKEFKYVDVDCGDFLEKNFQDPFKCIIMYPPRNAGADVKHTAKAINLLDINGVLVSIVGAGIVAGTHPEVESLRNRIVGGVGALLALPESTFQENEKPLRSVLLVSKRVR